VSKTDLARIIEGARWAPTAHNMQNYEIIAVDDRELLEAIGKIESHISETFLRENYKQMSFSKKDLRKRKVGVLGSMFPLSWRTPPAFRKISRGPPTSLGETIRGSPMVLIVTFDPGRRAPASRGDFLGSVSLGCVMENMWLVAQSLGIGFQVMSVFSSSMVESKLKKLLGIQKNRKIAFAMRLGYPVTSHRYLRVRRDAATFLRHN
jgi:nitroreductase